MLRGQSGAFPRDSECHTGDQITSTTLREISLSLTLLTLLMASSVKPHGSEARAPYASVRHHSPATRRGR